MRIVMEESFQTNVRLSEDWLGLPLKGKNQMQQENYVRQSSGSKAIALDVRALRIRYRLLQLMALVLGAASAVGLHFIFAR